MGHLLDEDMFLNGVVLRIGTQFLIPGSRTAHFGSLRFRFNSVGALIVGQIHIMALVYKHINYHQDYINYHLLYH